MLQRRPRARGSTFAPAAALVLVAVLGLTRAAPAEAQFPELPTLQDLGVEYISSSGFFQFLLSGRLDVEAIHVGNAWSADTAGMNECDACHVDLGRQFRSGNGTMEVHRLRVFADIFLGDHLYALVELRGDRGFENFGGSTRGRVDQLFVRAVSGSGTEGLQVGRFSSPFGSYGARHLSESDPFLTPPLVYDYRTVMNRWRVPDSTDGFLTWKDAPEDIDLPSAPTIWDVPYQWGAMAFGRVGPFELRLAAMNSAPSSNPNAWKFDMERFERPSWVAGARWTVSPSLELGASYDRGPWMGAEITTSVNTAPPGSSPVPWPDDARDFHQELISADVTFARGPVVIRAEGVRDRWEVPNVDGMPTGLSAYLEVQSDVAAGFSLAARGGFIDFRPVDGASGASAGSDWDHDVYRLEASAGYRLSGNTGLLLSGYRQVQSDGQDGDTSFVGLRLWWGF